MKVLLVNPISPKNDLISGRKRQPLCLAWIASILRQNGHFVDLMDMNALERQILPLDRGYDWVVVTSSPLDRWETPYLDYSEAIKTIKKCKHKNIKTILIGPHGTVTPELILQQAPEIDIIVRGEPERTVEEIISGASLERIKGISYIKNKHIQHNPDSEPIDLNILPIPAYDLLPMDKYEYNVKDFPQPFTIMETSRGCPHQCIFCFKAMHGTTYRARTPENVIKEIKYLVDNFGIKSIYFQDLEFTLDRKRVIEICRLIKQNGFKIHWACASRVQDADEELLKAMKDAGCESISFGVESLSPIILKNIRKGVTPEEIAWASRNCKKTGINFNSFFTEGHPGETSKTVEEFFRNAFRYKIKPRRKRLAVIPYPGTQLFKIAQDKGMIKEDNWWQEAKRLQGKVGTGDFRKKTIKSWLYFILTKLYFKFFKK